MSCLLSRCLGCSTQPADAQITSHSNKTAAHIRFALAVLVALTLCGGRHGWSEEAAGDAANGKRPYVTVGCYQCHGRVGQGGAFTGPAPVIAKTALPIEAFIAFIHEPAENMPAYPASVLPDNSAADIYAYLQSVPGPRPVREVPLLQD
jgi:mono/diheme cytochrome c family protein